MIHPLAKHHTVYTMDLIGCGRSDKPKITYTSYLYVQLINDFIKDIIHEKTDIIAAGNSCSIVVQACNMEKKTSTNCCLSILITCQFQNISWPAQNASEIYAGMPDFGTFTYNIIHSMPMVEHRFYKNIIRIHPM